jgi:hypothetical protein
VHGQRRGHAGKDRQLWLRLHKRLWHGCCWWDVLLLLLLLLLVQLEQQLNQLLLHIWTCRFGSCLWRRQSARRRFPAAARLQLLLRLLLRLLLGFSHPLPLRFSGVCLRVRLLLRLTDGQQQLCEPLRGVHACRGSRMLAAEPVPIAYALSC